MAKKKKIISANTLDMYTKANLKWLDCKECGISGGYVSQNVKAYTCSSCVSDQVSPPEEKAKPEEKRPRGWHFMDEYISPSGKIYHKGVEINESISSNTRNVAGDVGGSKKSRKSKKDIGEDNTSTAPRKRGRPPKNRK